VSALRRGGACAPARGRQRLSDPAGHEEAKALRARGRRHRFRPGERTSTPETSRRRHRGHPRGPEPLHRHLRNLDLRRAIAAATARGTAPTGARTKSSPAAAQELLFSWRWRCSSRASRWRSSRRTGVVPEQIRLCGAEPVLLRTREEDGFVPGPATSSRTPGRSRVLLNSPCNPHRRDSRREVERLAAFASRTGRS